MGMTLAAKITGLDRRRILLTGRLVNILEQRDKLLEQEHQIRTMLQRLEIRQYRQEKARRFQEVERTKPTGG